MVDPGTPLAVFQGMSATNPGTMTRRNAIATTVATRTSTKLATVRVTCALVGGVTCARDFMIIAALRFNVARNPRYAR